MRGNSHARFGERPGETGPAPAEHRAPGRLDAPAAPPAGRRCPGSRSTSRTAAPRPRHGRREIRTLKVVTVAAGIAFPHAAQAVQIVRRTRPVNARTGEAGRWRTETVYAITDLTPHQAGPAELAAWIRGHWADRGAT